MVIHVEVSAGANTWPAYVEIKGRKVDQQSLGHIRRKDDEGTVQGGSATWQCGDEIRIKCHGVRAC